jgi:hypothetical protein
MLDSELSLALLAIAIQWFKKQEVKVAKENPCCSKRSNNIVQVVKSSSHVQCLSLFPGECPDQNSHHLRRLLLPIRLPHSRSHYAIIPAVHQQSCQTVSQLPLSRTGMPQACQSTRPLLAPVSCVRTCQNVQEVLPSHQTQD